MPHIFFLTPILIPIIGLMIPIVAILTKHQQKMAEIMNRRVDFGPELQQLRFELSELRSRLNQQALSIDSPENQARLAGASTGTVGDQSQRLQENLRSI